VLLYLERYGVHTGTFVDQSSSSDGLMFGSFQPFADQQIRFAAVLLRQFEVRFISLLDGLASPYTA
jgi:hypothetical protein